MLSRGGSFLASARELIAILDLLQTGKWLLSESEEDGEVGAYVSVAKARELVEATSAGDVLALFLEAPGGAEEWPDEQPEFTAEVCDHVRVIDSPRTIIVPAGEAELSLPCPSCDADIFDLVRKSPVDRVAGELLGAAYHSLPSSCPNCQVALQAKELATFSDDEQIDDVPLFHFCIALTAAAQPGEAWVTADPGLLSSLESATGTPFRSIGRWG